MKKLFKKSIACLIAVLMVVSTMPFTAVTAQAATATEVANAKNGLTLATLQAAQPETFNAQAWFETSAAAGSNVIYCSQTLSETGQTNKGYINWRFVFPSVAIMAYDGKNNVYSPAVVTTIKVGGGGALTNCKAEWVAVSDSQHAELRQEWKGYTDYKSGSHTWPGNATNEAFGYLTSGTENLSDSVSNTKTERAWGNLLYYNGNGSSDGSTYYDTVANLKFNVKSNAITGNTTDKTASFTNYYINYAPVRQILANEATHTVDGTVYNVQGLFSFIDANENKFTADSLVAYYNALKAVIGLNVKNSFSGVNDSNAATTVSTVANNIKKVVSNYNNAVAGLTRQYLVTFKYNNGDTASSAYYTLNQTPTAPTTNTESYYDETQHHTYSWPAVSIVTGDKTYNENKKSVNHSYTDEKLTDANCTENGSTKRTCACGYSYTDFTIPAATGHTWREDAEVPANCTSSGTYAGKTCTECGVTEGYGEIPATGVHNYNVKVSDKQDATCTTPGKEAVYKCATCELTTGGETIKAKGHDWGEWTSNGNGTHTRTCKNDASHTENDNCSGGEATCSALAECGICKSTYGSLNQDNHKNTRTVPAKDPTCTEAGWEAYTYCDDCNNVVGKKVDLPAAEHDYKVTKKDDTYHTYNCNNCTDSYDEAHTWGSYSVTTPATCTTNAIETATCTVEGCGATISREVENSAINHDWNEWTSNGNGTHTRICKNDSTHTENGNCSGGTATCTILAECDVCKSTYGSLGAHALEKTEAKGATCKEDGNSEYWTCSDCGKMFSDAEGAKEITEIPTISATGVHNYNVPISEEVKATCTTPGTTAVYKCATCDDTTGGETINPLKHTYGAWTSNGDGTHSKSCTRNCGEDNATVTEDCSGMQDGVCDLCGYKTFDLVSYNKAVDEYNAIKNDSDYTTKYTAKSRDDYKKAVEAAMKDTFASQAEVDAATAAILSAKTKLVYANFDVKFVVVDESGFDTVVETRNVNYGDSVTFTKDVDNIAKWIVTTQNGKVETKVATSETSYTMIATEPATVSVYLSADKTEPVQYSKVSFISKNGAVAKVQYVKVGVTLNTATVDGIEIPFYNFAGWNKASVYADGSDIEVKALYTFIEEEAHKCNVHYEGFAGGVKQYSYDSFVYLFGAEDKTLALSTDGTEANIITYLNENAFYAPHTTDIYVIEVSTMNASIGITGSYASSTNDTKSATFNCKFFVPAGCKVVEYGLTAYSEKGAYKVKGETASARGEYCIKVTLDKTSPVNSMDGEAYLTYMDADNTLVTIYSSRVTQNL